MRSCALIHQPADRDKAFVVVSGIQQVVPDPAFKRGMDKPDRAGSYFGNDTNMSDMLAFGTGAFEKDQIAGSGVIKFHGCALSGLGCAGMWQGNIKFIKTISHKSRAVKTLFGSAAGTVRNMQMLGREGNQRLGHVERIGSNVLFLWGLGLGRSC